jgi:hypothetical protein
MNQAPIHPRTIQRIVEDTFGDDLHAKQRESIGHCVIGAQHTESGGRGRHRTGGRRVGEAR